VVSVTFGHLGETIDPVNCKAQPLTQAEKRLGEELSEVIFLLIDRWWDFSFEVFPQRFDRIQRRRVRWDEDELNAEFVGPLLAEFRVMGAVVVRHEQNPVGRILLADLLQGFTDDFFDNSLTERNRTLPGQCIEAERAPRSRHQRFLDLHRPVERPHSLRVVERLWPRFIERTQHDWIILLFLGIFLAERLGEALGEYLICVLGTAGIHWTWFGVVHPARA